MRSASRPKLASRGAAGALPLGCQMQQPGPSRAASPSTADSSHHPHSAPKVPPAHEPGEGRGGWRALRMAPGPLPCCRAPGTPVLHHPSAAGRPRPRAEAMLCRCAGPVISEGPEPLALLSVTPSCPELTRGHVMCLLSTCCRGEEQPRPSHKHRADGQGAGKTLMTRKDRGGGERG